MNKKKDTISKIVICISLCILIYTFINEYKKMKTPLNTGVSYSEATDFDETIPFKVKGEDQVEFSVSASVKEGDMQILITNPENVEVFNKKAKKINEKVKVKAIKGMWSYRVISKSSTDGKYNITCKLKNR
ncbi:hypothetical protein [Haloimpatiens massiliensis]|uniref:hypothetical protein n=1 Tax=Haloimpatiens massiliensis TaxID=1658110 RepID=UPI000C82B650|nr:hypothetical protein [Haloimpatiens massiliensis]